VKFLVLGAGSIGCRHIRNLQSMGCSDIAAHDADSDILKLRCDELGIGPTDDYQSELEQCDALVVCSPPSSHVDAALEALRTGKYVFIEKPLSNTVHDAQRLLDYEDKIMVGYNVRYHPLVTYIQGVLPGLGKIFNVQMEFAYDLKNARPNADYRKGYYAKAGEGGVLLDHIHELDYAQYLFGRFRSVFCLAERISDLEITSEDNANLVLKSEHGFSVTLHIDYIQQRYSRNIKIVAERGVLSGDFTRGRATLLPNGGDEVVTEFPASFDETYVEEMKDFVALVNGNRTPSITVVSAMHSLELCEAAHESNRTGCVVNL
jgi:predicted dehydrogenase